MSTDAIGATELLARVWLFSELGERELAQLASIARACHVHPGTAVVRKGDHDRDLYAVAHGFLKASIPSEDGRELVLNVLRAGEVFGEIALLDGSARSAEVRALSACDLFVIERAHFLALLAREPNLSIKLLQTLARRVRELTGRAEDAAFLGMRERLAKRLLGLAEACGTPIGPNQVALQIRLSQQELGNLVQASRESVNKCMRGWMRGGVVQRTKSQLVIRDLSALQALAGMPAAEAGLRAEAK